MDNQELRTLRILEEIDRDQEASQRTLARRMNVSLGLVNSFVKRLAHKGYFKISTIPSNRVKYILTPKGAAEKTRLTYEYIRYSFQFYKDAREKLRSLLDALEKRGVRRIIFYGVGDLAEIAYITLQEFDIELAGVVDSEKRGGKFLGHPIEAPEKLVDLSFDKLLLTELCKRRTTVTDLERMGVGRDRIVELR